MHSLVNNEEMPMGLLNMITVWGRKTSSNVQVVMWAAAELGLEVEHINAGGSFGGTDTQEFIAMNPNRRVPVIKDGDLVLYESSAILRYLAAEYGDGTFWPIDNKNRAKLDIWAEWTKNTICPVLIYSIFWTLVRTSSAERDMDALAASVKEISLLMQQVETQLEGKDYLGGNSLTFADIMLGHVLYRYFTLGFQRLDLPNLQAYYDRLTSRQTYRDNVMIDYSPLQVD